MNAAAPAGLAAWLLGTGPAPPVAVLRAARLGGYAHQVLPPDHPHQAALAQDHALLALRHEQARRAVLPLLRALRAAGIELLLFKGFHLSELVYPTRGMRYYGDVDVLVRAGDVAGALEAAAALGWTEERNNLVTGRAGVANAATLVAPGGDAQVDLHVQLPRAVRPFTARQRRITRAVWEAARERAWEGIRIREMRPVDAVLVGLVIARGWHDGWALKPHDWADLRLLSSLDGGFSRAELEARAAEIGCGRTLRVYLHERCDPAAGRLELAPPSGRQAARWDWRIAAERGPPGLLRKALAAATGTDPAPRLLRGVRWLAAARRARAGAAELEQALARLRPEHPVPRGSARERFHTARGIRIAAGLLGRGWDPEHETRTLAAFAALRRQGWPVVFVRGTGRVDAARAHHWLELEGRPLWELKGPRDREPWNPVLRYPADAGDGARQPPQAGVAYEVR